MDNKRVGFNKLVDFIGESFCYSHKDVSCFSSEETENGLYCFLGFDLHADTRPVTLSCDIDDWDVYATCIVIDGEATIEKYKLPVLT